MALVDRRTGIEIIDRSECLRLLADETFGRVGVLDGGHPLILPVNYALDGDQVVFRTGEGTKLDAVRGPACFEIDAHDDRAHTGWSVVVRGRLEQATADQQDLAQPWAVEGEHALRIVPASIRGRRVRPPLG
jgi:nitroimidazol reductase NimA-like FMN-containing flavoprotein (pyridoxamine 5'-phosphate oxidase superfamily)